ncbi:uncharacterized protein BDR25DRAFT_196405, partial [Lindgomyces ingoldianus]
VYLALSLTGCVSQSPGVPNIFLVKLQSKGNTTFPIPEIRVGYFGKGHSLLGQLTCQPSSGKNATAILQPTSTLSVSNEANSYRLASMISLALTIQSRVMPAFIAGAGVMFTISIFFVVLLKRDFKTVAKGNTTAARRRQFLRKALFTVSWLSVSFSLASAIAVNQTTNGMAFVTQTEVSSVRITTGTALNVLQWLAFTSSALFAA